MKLTWLGHNGFHMETPGGSALLVDPWIENPLANDTARRLVEKADLLLLTHGHGDHMGSVARVGLQTGATVVGIHEIAVYLGTKGMKNEIIGMNKGGTIDVGDLRITMVHADHSSSIQDGDNLIPGGECIGYVIRFEDGYGIYHAGDTGLFGDMALIGELYRPDVAILPIGDRYTMGPMEAAHAVRLIKPTVVVPMHYRTFPALTGTLDAFCAALGQPWADRVIAPAVGETVTLPGETGIA